MQHLLHVQGEQEELREDRRSQQQGGDVRGRQRAQAEDAHRKQRRGRTQLDHEEPDDQGGRGGEEPDRLGSGPAMLARVRERVHEQHQAAGDRRGAGRVEVAVVEVGAALLQEQRADREHEDADGDVDEEDPGPAECAGQRAAEQDAGCASASGGCAPDPEGDVAVASLPERRGQDRECRRR